MIYYTSDLHLGHKNIINHEDRPFSGLINMEKELIYNWNSVVGKKDTVIIVGDFCFEVLYLVRLLSGAIYVLK